MRKTLFFLLILTTLAFSQTYYKGLVFDDEAYQNTPTTAKLLTRDLELLPPSVSLRPYAPTVGSQGQLKINANNAIKSLYFIVK